MLFTCKLRAILLGSPYIYSFNIILHTNNLSHICGKKNLLSRILDCLIIGGASKHMTVECPA